MIAVLSVLAGLWKSPLGKAGAAVLALAIYTAGVAAWARQGVKAKVETRIVERVVQAQAKETVRRETVLKAVQVRSQRDIAELDRLATKLAAAQEESRRASLAHDGDACLAADSVVRLAAVR